jgi:hypothetical protein
MNLRVTIGWCSEFHPRITVPPLVHASRPPALFMHRLGLYVSAGQRESAVSVITDENLGLRTATRDAIATIAASDIVYLTSHGGIRRGEYRFRMRDGEWPVVQDMGTPGPAVIVFDTCELVKRHGTFNQAGWLAPGRRCPAIVLGFVGPVSAGYVSTGRGRAFAELLALGQTFAHAWAGAVMGTRASRRDLPIAVAFGTTEAEAKRVLETASLANMPVPTTADACWRT